MAQNAPEVPFLFSPGDSNKLLNYEDTKDAKFYSSASKPLTTLFDLKPDGLIGFLNAVEQRSSQYGWSHLFRMFPETVDSLAAAPPGSVRNLLSQYGECSLAREQPGQRVPGRNDVV
jgi:hypothetical protein